MAKEGESYLDELLNAVAPDWEDTSVSPESLMEEFEEEMDEDVSLEDAHRYIKEGHFAPGSMLPKVQAAVDFAGSKPGRTALITLLEKSRDAVQGKTGTMFHL